MVKFDFQSFIQQLVDELTLEVSNQNREGLSVRTLSFEHAVKTTSYFDGHLIEKVELIEDDEDISSQSFHEPRIEQEAYSDDGRLISMMSDGSIKITDPYDHSVEIISLTEDYPEEG